MTICAADADTWSIGMAYAWPAELPELKPNPKPELPAVIIPSTRPSPGEPVVGIGNAGGTGGTPSYAGGRITALNQSITAGDALRRSHRAPSASTRLPISASSMLDHHPGDKVELGWTTTAGHAAYGVGPARERPASLTRPNLAARRLRASASRRGGSGVAGALDVASCGAPYGVSRPVDSDAG